MIDKMTNLKRIRLGAGITQLTVATDAGISLRTYQDYEQGRKNINGAAAITVLRIAKTLNVPVEDLLELESS